MKPKIIDIHSNGGGVQSEFIYRRAASGWFRHVPMISLFADTQDEAAYTYDALSRMESDHGHRIPIRRVTMGHLSGDWWDGQESKRGEPAMGAALPLHIQNPDPDKKKGQAMRTCSDRYKLSALRRETRKLIKETGADGARMWIGFSLDEASRMAPSRISNVENYFPLIFDRPTRRGEILHWFDTQGMELPKRSACVMCPLRSNSAFRELRENDPEGFERACAYDERLRTEPRFVSSFSDPAKSHLRGVPFVHASLVPLREADLEDTSRDQLNLFESGCDKGFCGV